MNDLAMKRVKRLTRLQRFSPIAIFLALFIIMTIVSPTFLQRASVMNLLTFPSVRSAALPAASCPI